MTLLTEINHLREFKSVLLNLCIVVVSVSFVFFPIMQNLDNVTETVVWEEARPLIHNLVGSESMVLSSNNQEYLYYFGGEQSKGAVSNNVRYAPLAQNGYPEAWQSGMPLPISLQNHAVAVLNNLVFIIGGKTNPGEVSGVFPYSNRVYCGQLDAEGKIQWESDSLLPDTLGWLAYHAVVASSERVYIIGGYNIDGYSHEVWSFVPGDDCQGELIWQPEGNLVTGLANHSATLITLENNQQLIYVIGGVKTSSLTNLIQYAKIEPSGTLSKWETLGELTFVVGLQEHRAIVSERFLYLIGGSTSYTVKTALSSVYRAAIEENGNLGSWEKLNNLPYPMHSHTTAVSNSGQIYLLGGDAGKDDFIDRFYFTPLFWLSKVADPVGEVFAGDQITYTIHYTNNGLRPLSNVIISDRIPVNTWLIHSDYPPDTEVISWIMPEVTMNESGTRTFMVQVRPQLTAVPPQLTTPVPSPTVAQPDLGLHCSTSWSGDGGTPRPTCTPISTPIPLTTTPSPTPSPESTRQFDSTPVPILNQAWLCEANRCIQSNTVINTPYHWYLPIIFR